MRAVLLIGLVFALAACDSAGPDTAESSRVPIDPLQLDYIDLNELSQDPDSLVGTWDWVASVTYFTAGPTPHLSTPDSLGYTQTLVFEDDGTVAFYEDGDLVRETTYTVARRTYGNGTQDARPSLRFEDGGYGEDFGVGGDLLVLDSTPVDGPQSRYRRR